MLRDVVLVDEQRSDGQESDVEGRRECWAKTRVINKENTLGGTLLPAIPYRPSRCGEAGTPSCISFVSSRMTITATIQSVRSTCLWTADHAYSLAIGNCSSESVLRETRRLLENVLECFEDSTFANTVLTFSLFEFPFFLNRDCRYSGRDCVLLTPFSWA
jgi:hypothetical protein